MKKYLFIIRRSPYANSLAAETLELALALSAFDQSVSLLFIGDGVLQLIDKQEADLIGCKQFTKAYKGLQLFAIKDVFIAQSTLQQFPDIKLAIEPEIVDDIAINNIIAAHDIVLDF